jgi:hypothetical protein
MSKTLTIRKSKDDEKWLREQQQATARSQGEILKNLLQKAREQKPGSGEWMKYCGGAKVGKDASGKKGFIP